MTFNFRHTLALAAHGISMGVVAGTRVVIAVVNESFKLRVSRYPSPPSLPTFSFPVIFLCPQDYILRDKLLLSSQ